PWNTGPSDMRLAGQPIALTAPISVRGAAKRTRARRVTATLRQIIGETLLFAKEAIGVTPSIRTTGLNQVWVPRYFQTRGMTVDTSRLGRHFPGMPVAPIRRLPWPTCLLNPPLLTRVFGATWSSKF